MPPSSLASRNDKSMCDRVLVIWTKEEDDILREQVKLYGIDKWAKIATHLCGKTSRQCRRRWHMFLNVVNKRGGWSSEEDKLLLEAHRKFGNRWTEIAKKLPGRTDNAVKNRFCVLCKKQTKEVEVSPLQRSIDSGSDIAKRRLPERRSQEAPKATLGSGANKKMRIAANNNRKSELVVQQRPLEETLQQWKGLQSSEVLTSSSHKILKQGSVRPWDSNVLLHHTTQVNTFPGWMGLAVEGKGMSNVTSQRDATQEMQLGQTFQQWEGSKSEAGNHDPMCSTTLLSGEARSFEVLQPHIPSVSSSSHSILRQENLQQWTRANMGDISSADRLHHQRMLKTSHSAWCRAKTTDSSNNLGSEGRPDNELLQWWKGVDKDTMPTVALQQRDVDEAIHHWKENSQTSVPASLNHHRSIDENLPPLSEMNSLVAAYMSNSKQRTLASDMQSWSAVQPGKQSEHVQQSSAGGTQTWDQSLAKEANDTTSNTNSKENMNEWQDWNSNEGNHYAPCQDGPLEHIMEIHDRRHDDSAESISLEASAKTLPLWTSPNRQQGNGSPNLDETQQRSETPTKIPSQRLDDRLKQWQKSEFAVQPGPLISMLSRFAGSDSRAPTEQVRAQSQRQGGHKSQLIEDSWKSAVEKLKCVPSTFTTNTQTQSPRGVLGFAEYVSGESKVINLETAAVFPPAVPNPSQPTKAVDSKWELQVNVKDGEGGEINIREAFLTEKDTCEASPDGCGTISVEVKLTTEGEVSRVTESPTSDIRTDGAQSPSQIVPRSHVTMECMPSPQFSDSEKEFLLSTLALDQTTGNCWSSSPLRPPTRFGKVRNPLFDTRYDTPARSPLSSCLLRQFQVSDATQRT